MSPGSGRARAGCLAGTIARALRRTVPLCAALIGLFVVVAAAMAADPPWRPAGPDGGMVWDVQVSPHDPDLALAVGGRELFRTTDGAGHWDWVEEDRMGDAVTVAFDPVNASVVWAAASKGLFKSTDAGATWREVPVPGGDPDDAPWGIAVSAGAPQRVWIGHGNRVLRSPDGGATWTTVRALPFAQGAIAASPVAPQRIFVSADGKFLRSTDGGETWVESVVGETFEVIATTPADPQLLWGSGYSGVRKSTDGGATWTPVNVGTAGGVGDITISPVDGDRVHVATHLDGVLWTADGGTDWEPAGAGLPADDVYGLAVARTAPQTMYAATADGAARTTDGGATWVPASRGLSGVVAAAHAVHPADPKRMLVLSEERVYRTADGGATWTAGPRLFTGPSNVSSLAISSGHPAIAYAADGIGSLRRSGDGGATWTDVIAGFTGAELVVDAGDPDVLYARDLGRITKSTEGGVTWAYAESGLTGLVQQLTGHPHRSGVLYAVTSEGVFRTGDGGASWTRIGAAVLPDPFSDRLQVAPDPAADDGIVVASGDGVFRSPDGGASWTHRPGPFEGDASAVAVNPADPDIIAVLTVQGWNGVYRVFSSADGGATWAEVPDVPALVAGLRFDSAGSALYLASELRGLLRNTALAADVTPPAIRIGRPVDGAVYRQGEAVASEFSCADTGPGARGVRSCTGPATLDTGTPGPKTFTVTAIDRRGNTATRSVAYRVEAPPATGGMVPPPPAAVRAPAVRVPKPVVKLTVRGNRLRLAVTVRLPKAAKGRLTRIEYRRGRRWTKAVRLRVPANGVVKRTVTLTRARIGGPKVRVLRVRVVLPRTAAARAATGKVRAVRVPAPRRAPARR